MSSVKSTGSSNTSAVSTQPSTSSTTRSGESKATNGTSASSTPTPQETKSSQQLATAKKEEFGLSLVSTKLNSVLDSAKEAIVKEVEIKKVEESAKQSGLDPLEKNKLTESLRKMEFKSFETEAKFLKEKVLGTPNTDRALRTYIELKGMQVDHPAELQDKHIHLLTTGVAQPRATYISNSGERTAYPTGAEGVLGQDGAKKAAEALIGMPESDYKVVDSLLDAAGKKEGREVSGSNPELEKVLILKAVGAHHQTLTNPSNTDKAWTMAGEPSSKMSEIAFYAKEIRGETGSKVARESTSIDPYYGNSALQQRWQLSCGPTTTQGMKAEIDPIYARKLHQEVIHSTSTGDNIAAEQKEILENNGGTATARATAGGAPGVLNDMLNAKVSPYTGVTYAHNSIIPPDAATRGQELDKVATKLKAGVDVPINAIMIDYTQSPLKAKYEHFMYLTDVRGSGTTQKFLLTDPWEGKTVWLTRQELVSGRTQFPIDEGQLEAAYY